MKDRLSEIIVVFVIVLIVVMVYVSRKPILNFAVNVSPADTVAALRDLPIKKLMGCAQDAEAEPAFTITEKNLKPFLTGAKEIEDQVDPFSVCYHVGDQVILVTNANFLALAPIVTGAGTVTKVTTWGKVTVNVTSREGGHSGLMPPVCGRRCTAITEELPASKTDLLIYFSLTDEQVAMLKWTGPSIRVTPKMLMKPQLKNIPPNAVCHIITDQPNSFRQPLNHLMRLLRFRGVQKIYWIYKGVAGLAGMPLTVPPLPKVQAITALELPKILKSTPIYVGTPAGADDLLSGTIVVKAEMPLNQSPHLTMGNWHQTPIWTEARFPGIRLPPDKSAPYLIYADNKMDWRAFHLLSYMQAKGYTNLSWLKNGNEEILDLKVFE